MPGELLQWEECPFYVLLSSIIYKKMGVPAHKPIPGRNEVNVTSSKMFESPKIEEYALSPCGKGKKMKELQHGKGDQQQYVLQKSGTQNTQHGSLSNQIR